MFIRESKTTNKKTGTIYVKHTLVESVRTEKGPRQRLVMTLGRLNLDRSLWKELAFALESHLNGGQELEHLSLFELPTELLEEISRQRAIIQHHQQQRATEVNSKPISKDIQAVDLNTLTVTESRSLGPELVANNVWQQLGFEKILRDCGFSDKEVALAAAVIWGRLICPGSDLATWRWLRESSSLPDFFDEDISKVHKDKIYEIADKLLVHKDTLESKLYDRQCDIFNLKKTLFLFDLTNFYFEGKGEKNDLAKRGKSKEKRSQNVLVSLALIVDEYGFPVRSEVFEGNIGEPQTLKTILEKAGFLNDKEGELPFRPTLAMDRGIATKENIEFIKSENFSYTVIQRANKVPEFKDHFEKMDGFTQIEDTKGQKIHLKNVENQLLCVSESRAKKECAMSQKKVERITKDLVALEKAINKGNLKDSTKIQQRIGRIKERHKGFDKLFEVNFSTDGDKPLTYSKKSEGSPYAGCYIIEHDGLEGNEEQLWRIYTTLTKVEAAFRSMKTDLGTRPVYHQGAERTRGHLFLSILAYHMLSNIEHQLDLNQGSAHWGTICQQLGSHRRSVIQWQSESGSIQHKKVSSKPEPHHLDIYRKLNIRNPLKDFKY
jgi:transposase